MTNASCQRLMNSSTFCLLESLTKGVEVKLWRATQGHFAFRSH